jgi:murein L,D-transpeptidase YafK
VISVLGLALFGAAGLGARARASEAPRTTKTAKADRLVLDTQRHRLSLYRGRRLLARYRVGLGRGGVGKRRLGDGKTPRGTYRVGRPRASRNYLRFIPIGYPNRHDADRGLAAGLIDARTHARIVAALAAGRMPPQDTALGGHVGIHGYGKKLGFVPRWLQVFHRFFDRTLGCVMVSDREILEIEQSLSPGATIVIR